VICEPLGACCYRGECIGTITRAECDGQGGIWFADADCTTFQCPQQDCLPTSDGTACTQAGCLTSTDTCEARCINFEPLNGVWHVIDCDCRGEAACFAALTGTTGGCTVPDDGTGTASLPPVGCNYLSPDEVFMIIDGLPPGTTIEAGPDLKDFVCQTPGAPQNHCGIPGGSLGGEVEQFTAMLDLQMVGTGELAGFARSIQLPVAAETASGPRNPGDPVQTFPNEMLRLQGSLSGDPDFDQLTLTGGTLYGLPSPGNTTLTRLGDGTFNVDSFFDITYQIDFAGAPGGQLEGLSGTTTGTLRMRTGSNPVPTCVGVCPIGMTCNQTRTPRVDGSYDLCCDCAPIPPEACCGPDGRCIDAPPLVCRESGGTPQGAGTNCATTECAPPWVEHDFFADTTAIIQLVGGPFGASTTMLTLRGPMQVDVTFDGPNEGDARDDDGNGRDEVDTEIVSMSLTGGGATLTLNPARPSLGQIEELVNNTAGLLDVDPFAPGDADSFFDVFFEISVGTDTLHNETPLRMRAVIDEKPPLVRYIYMLPQGVRIELFDPNGNATGVFLVKGEHYTGHTELDPYGNSWMELHLTGPDGSSEVVDVGGLTFMTVYFEPLEGAARDDNGDGLDEVQTELVAMSLDGQSSMGPVHLQLRDGLPVPGLMTETSNANPGRLDVPPFGTGFVDSFFDVFFDIQIGGNAYETTVVRLDGLLSHKPAAPGDVYNRIDTGPVQLIDPATGEFTGWTIGALRLWPVPAGACCVDGACIKPGTEAACLDLGGRWFPELTCADVICPEACCFPDGTCADASPRDCIARGGNPMGPGSDCANTPCEPIPCEQSLFPACGGVCPPGSACQPVSGAARCACITIGLPCTQCGPGPHFIDACGPFPPVGTDLIADDSALVGIDINLDCIEDLTFSLHPCLPPNELLHIDKVLGPIDDSVNFPGTSPVDGHPTGPGLDVIDTELVSMCLTNGTITLTAGASGPSALPLQPSLGTIAEDLTTPDPSWANSIFGIYFEVAGVPGGPLYNQSPLKLRSRIDCLPPAANFIHPEHLCLPLTTAGYCDNDESRCIVSTPTAEAARASAR